MNKFEVGKRYYFKGDDLTRMCGECIERDDLSGIEFVVFRFPEKELFVKCFVNYELGDSGDAEILYCTKKDKSYTSNARWVAE